MYVADSTSRFPNWLKKIRIVSRSGIFGLNDDGTHAWAVPKILVTTNRFFSSFEIKFGSIANGSSMR